MVYELHKHRLHILNLRSERCAAACRYADGEKVDQQAPHDRRSRVCWHCETNLPAQLFFRTLGFRATTVLRKFYEDTPEDAYLMQYRYAAGANANAEELPTRMAG
jgi:ribosomal-protein-alanine N-acetyltransferase